MIIAWVFLFVLAAGTAYFADKKGRSPFGWFLLTLLLGMIAPVLLYFLGEQPAVSNAKQPTATQPETSVQKKLSFATHIDWYYLDQNRQQVGPVSGSRLQDLQDQGIIGPNTYLWKEGMESWQKMAGCLSDTQTGETRD